MSQIIPTVLVRNEEYHIAAVLHALVDVFGCVVMGDTGSLDRTPQIAKAIPGVQFHEFGRVTPAGFTECRFELGELAAKAGATWQLLCDGDELYSRRGLLVLRDFPMPEGKTAGFTSMMTLDRDDDGDIWEMADQFSRLAVMPAHCQWHGDYPFDIPEVFEQKHYHYYPAPVGLRFHAVHLHRLPRSTEDSETMMRVRKQKQFAMRDRPDVQRTVRFDLRQWERL